MPLLICIILNLLIAYGCRPLVRQSPQQVFWQPLTLLLLGLDAFFAAPLLLFPHQFIAWLVALTSGLFLLGIASYALITRWLVLRQPIPSRADYLVVLGAQVTSTGPSPVLMRRLNTAFDYYYQQPFPPKLILSGGQGTGEPTSEATTMAGIALSHHIPQHQLLLENQSTSTQENFSHSAQLIKTTWQGPHTPTVVVATSDYHLLRSRYWAYRTDLQVTVIGAPTTITSLFHAMTRELLALTWQLKFFCFGIWSSTLLITWFLIG